MLVADHPVLLCHAESDQSTAIFSPTELRLLFCSRKAYNLPPDLSVLDFVVDDVFHKAAISANQNTVLLFEEPEAHMFPPYIAKFTADVMFDKNDNQYFIATHSPFVLNDFMEDMDKDELSIYIVGLKDGETIVRKITEEEITEIYQYGIDLFFNLENFLKDAV